MATTNLEVTCPQCVTDRGLQGRIPRSMQFVGTDIFTIRKVDVYQCGKCGETRRVIWHLLNGGRTIVDSPKNNECSTAVASRDRPRVTHTIMCWVIAHTVGYLFRVALFLGYAHEYLSKILVEKYERRGSLAEQEWEEWRREFRNTLSTTTVFVPISQIVFWLLFYCVLILDQPVRALIGVLLLSLTMLWFFLFQNVANSFQRLKGVEDPYPVDIYIALFVITLVVAVVLNALTVIAFWLVIYLVTTAIQLGTVIAGISFVVEIEDNRRVRHLPSR